MVLFQYWLNLEKKSLSFHEIEDYVICRFKSRKELMESCMALAEMGYSMQ